MTASRIDVEEPPVPAKQLMERARQAALGAHAPYSKFRVGAALVVGGQIVDGCNVENASYGLTMCAERVAAFTAAARGLKGITHVALSCVDADSAAGNSERMPCGACRQVLAELGSPQTQVWVDGVGEFRLEQLLPEPFDLRK